MCFHRTRRRPVRCHRQRRRLHVRHPQTTPQRCGFAKTSSKPWRATMLSVHHRARPSYRNNKRVREHHRASVSMTSLEESANVWGVVAVDDKPSVVVSSATWPPRRVMNATTTTRVLVSVSNRRANQPLLSNPSRAAGFLYPRVAAQEGWPSRQQQAGRCVLRLPSKIVSHNHHNANKNKSQRTSARCVCVRRWHQCVRCPAAADEC